MKICFVASSGGHLDELLMLKPLMDKYDSYIVTEKTEYLVLPQENVYYVQQINRKEKAFMLNFIRQFNISLKIFIKEKPDIVISTGALASVSTCIICKLFRKKLIFIESFADINAPTLTGKIVHGFSDLFIVQWHSLSKFYKKSTYGGGIY